MFDKKARRMTGVLGQIAWHSFKWQQSLWVYEAMGKMRLLLDKCTA